MALRGVRLDKQLLAEVDKKLGDKIKGGRPEILRYVLQCYWYVARVLDVCSHGSFAGRTTRGWGDLPAAAVKDPAMLEQEMAKLNLIGTARYINRTKKGVRRAHAAGLHVDLRRRYF